jgi:hypothetical protein
VRHRHTGIRPACLDRDARPHHPRRPPVGTQTTPTAPVHDPRHDRPRAKPAVLHLSNPAPWAQIEPQIINRLDHLTASPARPVPTSPGPPGPVEPAPGDDNALSVMPYDRISPHGEPQPVN